MKKTSLFLLGIALVAICTAFVTKPPKNTNGGPFDPLLYHWNGSMYVPILGTIGVDYICTDVGLPIWCTYINYGPGTFIGHDFGIYENLIFGIQEADPKVK